MHIVPHIPQWALLVMVLTQAPLQNVCPIGQRHMLDWHVRGVMHAAPHAPQWALSVAVFTQTPPQTVCPVGQRHMLD